MKTSFLIYIFVLCPFFLFSQNVEVLGGIIADSLNLSSGPIKNVADPILAQDAATKNYVDKMSEMMLDAGLNGIVEDIDGNVYKTIKIGSQVWMADNLKTTRYNNGTHVPKQTDDILWAGLASPSYCWFSNDSTSNSKLYGALYNYFVVADTNSLNICPIGWDIPNEVEWFQLKNYLTATGYGFQGSGTDIGKSVAASFSWIPAGTSGKISFDIGTNNGSGFSGIPSGARDQNGVFTSFGLLVAWWSSIESSNSTFAKNHFLFHTNDDFKVTDTNKKFGYSVRCLKD